MTTDYRALLIETSAFLAEHYRGPGVDDLRSRIDRTLARPDRRDLDSRFTRLRANDTPPTAPPPPDDTRFTTGLLHDVLTVLDRHGYRPADDHRAYADALVALRRLCRAYEGTDQGDQP